MKSRIIKYSFMALFLCATFLILNKNIVKGATRNVLYLEVNEKWTVSLSTSNPVLYKYGDADKKVVSASISSKKVLTIKPLKAGSATLYVCKNNKKTNANIVRTIVVHSYAESQKVTPVLSNNISHNYDGDNYSNVSVYCYGGKGFTLSITASGIPGSVEAGATGGAKGYVASSIYECANSSGTDIKTGGKWYLSGNTMATRSRYFKATTGYNSTQTTYIKGCVYWTSSNGTKHWSLYKVIPIYVVPCPYINVYNQNGAMISTLNCILGEPQKVTFGVVGIGTSPINDKSCIATDDTKADVSEDGGGFLITPLAKTSITTYLKFTVAVDHWIIPYNGEEYSTFTKDIGLTIANLPTPKFIGVHEVSNGLKVEYDFVKGAGTYKILRALSENGDYEEVGVTAEKFFIDTEAEYNTEYFYKVAAIGTGGEEESSLTEAKSGMRYVATPQIKEVINHKNGIKIAYNFVKNIKKYNIYRSISKNGEYEEVGESSENYYIDNTATFGKKYFYKVSGVTSSGDEDSEYETPLSVAVSFVRYVFAPTVSSVKSVGSGLYQIKIDSIAKYSGYEVYVNGKLQVITNTKYATIKLNTGIYKIKVKAYKTVGKTKVYSEFSKTYKKTIRPKKPKVKKMVLRGRWVIKLKKQKKINGFIIKFSKTKSFNKFKTKKTKKTTFKIKRKYKYIKILSYKKVGSKYLVSKSKKYKLKVKR